MAKAPQKPRKAKPTQKTKAAPKKGNRPAGRPKAVKTVQRKAGPTPRVLQKTGKSASVGKATIPQSPESRTKAPAVAQPPAVRALPETQSLAEAEFLSIAKGPAVLLLTTNKKERNAVLHFFVPSKGRAKVIKGHIGQETYYAGTFAAYEAVLAMCAQGSGSRDGSLLAANSAIQKLSPAAVILVGFAWGAGPEKPKQRIADVLLSTAVIPFDPRRESEGETIPRGVPVLAGPVLLDRFREASGWEFRRSDGSQVEVHPGLVLSGEVLLDSSEKKADLLKLYPTAVGGEMEGVGVTSAASRHENRCEWILVKAICDWADGTKNKEHQPLAAQAAASFVYHVLSDKHALSALSTPRNNRQVAAAGKGARDRDTKMLRNLLRAVPMTIMERFAESLETGVLLIEGLRESEEFHGFVHAATFQVADPELLDRIRRFDKAWHDIWGFGDHMVEMPKGVGARFGSRPALIDLKTWEMRRLAFEAACDEVRRTYRSFVDYVKANYPELDIARLDREARKRRRAEREAFEEEPALAPAQSQQLDKGAAGRLLATLDSRTVQDIYQRQVNYPQYFDRAKGEILMDYLDTASLPENELQDPSLAMVHTSLVGMIRRFLGAIATNMVGDGSDTFMIKTKKWGESRHIEDYDKRYEAEVEAVVAAVEALKTAYGEWIVAARKAGVVT